MGIDRRYREYRSVLYEKPDLMHGKKGKAFRDAFDKTFGLKPL